MTPALGAALFSTVALLVTHGYFLMGSVPLRVLKHDTPMDARFVTRLFEVYYLAAFRAAAAAASLAVAGRAVLAAAAAGLVILAVLLRRAVI